MDGSVPMFAQFQFPGRRPPALPLVPPPAHMHIKQEPGTRPIGLGVPPCMSMYPYCSTPAQFQLPPGFQQLPDAVPIKLEPQDVPQMQPQFNLQQPQEDQPKGKAKAKKKKIKKEPVVRSGNIQEEEGAEPKKKLKQEKITEHLTVKKKRDRFNGMPEEEVVLRLLPDHLVENLDIVIVGINPGLFAAYVGHHYAGPGNHFWKCLYLSGLIPEPMNAYQDFELPKFGIGFTNICARTTRGSADLKKSEIQEGAAILKEKLKKWKPKIAAFNGKGIYEVYCGHKNFILGKQPDPVEGTNTMVYVMPSSSARCAQLPRAVDKVPFYLALKKLRDYVRGDTPILNESEVSFPDLELKIKTEPKTEPVDPSEAGAKSETKPKVESKSKSKGKKNKSANPPKTSQNQNIPVPTSQIQSTNGMWPVVKQEKVYDPSEYGGQQVGGQQVVSASTAPAMFVSQHMPVYQNAQMYSQPNGAVTSQAAAITHSVAKTTAALAATTNSTAMYYPAVAQNVYQGAAQSFNTGVSFMHQLQDSNLAQTNTQQTWQQYQAYPANQIIADTSANQRAGNNSQSQPQVVQVKSEPQEYGYTEIPFSNM